MIDFDTIDRIADEAMVQADEIFNSFGLDEEEQEEQEELTFYPKQQKILDSKANFIAINGAYGAGKSVVGFTKAFNIELKGKEVGLFVGVSTPSIRDLLNQYFDDAGIDFQIADNKKNFTYNGHKYFLGGADTKLRAKSFRGLSVKVACVEELTDDGFIKTTYQRVLQRLRGKKSLDYKPYLILAFNPTSPNHWTYSEIYTNPLFEVHDLNIFDNTFIDADQYVKTQGFTTERSLQSFLYRRDILGEWVVSEDYPFSQLQFVQNDSNQWDFCWCDPSLKGIDKSAITFFRRLSDKRWLVKGFCYNLATTEFLNLGKLKSDLDGNRTNIIEDNILGHFKNNLEKDTGRKWNSYHTSSNKIDDINKLTLPVMNGDILFAHDCQKEYINDIMGWKAEIKDQEDGAIDSLARGFKSYGMI